MNKFIESLPRTNLEIQAYCYLQEIVRLSIALQGQKFKDDFDAIYKKIAELKVKYQTTIESIERVEA